VTTLEASTAIIGSGIAGMLVARELLRAGDDVLVLERGELVPWERHHFAPDGRIVVEGDVKTAVHNDENAPDGVNWTWEYAYGVGGSLNHWIGTTPRWLPEDFQLRSRYGVLTDWPITYDELEPFYTEAERALAISGSASELSPGSAPPLPPHPFSPQDEAVRKYLEPFVALSQARPSRPVGGRPACCGSTRCEVCPIDARFSVLNGMRATLRDPGLRLRSKTLVKSLRLSPDQQRVVAAECVTASGEEVVVRADRFVLAANAIESTGLLLRSDIVLPATGRYFGGRQASFMVIPTKEPVLPGRGSSRSTGASYAYYSGEFRSHRGAALLMVENLGVASAMAQAAVEGLISGEEGATLRARATAGWERTLTMSVLVESEPHPENAVTLSPVRDSFGLPLNRVRYRPGDYERLALEHVVEDLPRRLRALGAGKPKLTTEPRSPHLLGTLRMGSERTGVVDSDLRHHGLDNLFVVGGSVFPTYSASQPTLTIAALAIRLGRKLASWDPST
jgi:choline dehydrogenase-like flavoprotein